MSLSDDAKNRLKHALTSSKVGGEVADAIDADRTSSEVSSALASTANAKGASLVGIEDAGTKYTATTVEGALAEVKALVDPTLSVALVAGAEVGNAISVTGIVKNALGATVEGSQNIIVEVFSPTADKGAITIDTGAEIMVQNAAGGSKLSVATVQAVAGEIAFTVTSDAADLTLVRVTLAGGLTSTILLNFAALP
jgi:hypothetical protein